MLSSEISPPFPSEKYRALLSKIIIFLFTQNNDFVTWEKKKKEKNLPEGERVFFRGTKIMQSVAGVFLRRLNTFAILHTWLRSRSAYLKKLLFRSRKRHYPRFYSSSSCYTRDSPRCPRGEDFSLYLRWSDPFRTRVAKVAAECIAASVSPSEIPVVCTSTYDYTVINIPFNGATKCRYFNWHSNYDRADFV